MFATTSYRLVVDGNIRLVQCCMVEASIAAKPLIFERDPHLLGKRAIFGRAPPRCHHDRREDEQRGDENRGEAQQQSGIECQLRCRQTSAEQNGMCDQRPPLTPPQPSLRGRFLGGEEHAQGDQLRLADTVEDALSGTSCWRDARDGVDAGIQRLGDLAVTPGFAGLDASAFSRMRAFSTWRTGPLPFWISALSRCAPPRSGSRKYLLHGRLFAVTIHLGVARRRQFRR